MSAQNARFTGKARAIPRVAGIACCLWLAATGFSQATTALPERKADLQAVTGVVETVGTIQEGRDANLYLRLAGQQTVFWYPGPATSQVQEAVMPGAETELWVEASELARGDRVRPWAIRANGGTVVFFDEVWAHEWRETRVLGVLTGVLFVACGLVVASSLKASRT